MSTVTPVKKRKTPVVVTPMGKLCSVDGGLDSITIVDDLIMISDERTNTVFQFEIQELSNCCGVHELGAFSAEKNIGEFTNFEEVLTNTIKKVVQVSSKDKGMKTVMAICNEDRHSDVMRKALIASGCFVEVKRWTNTNGSKLTMYVSNN